ncbi:MAG: rhodanese-like domain-containing protein [Sphaerochaetaceae bacterium]|jgi:phage shock protein E|nr:rhodanese-like domain-containing protein [Sphaerochaetaceae bacterium]
MQSKALFLKVVTYIAQLLEKASFKASLTSPPLFGDIIHMKKHWFKIVALALVIIMVTLACTGRPAKTIGEEASQIKSVITAQYRKISPELAKEMIDSGEELILVDVRTASEFNQGHIPGAILIPNETIGSTPPSELSDKEALILVYCRSGNRSAQAARKLVSMGYINVYDFGGITNWPYEVVR